MRDGKGARAWIPIPRQSHGSHPQVTGQLIGNRHDIVSTKLVFALGAAMASLTFGAFEVRMGTGELLKHGIRVRLQRQPFQILSALLARPGEVITRAQLHEQLWADGTFVEFEHGLNSAINRLREVFGDNADAPKFIETLPRLGYRFIASVVSPP